MFRLWQFSRESKGCVHKWNKNIYFPSAGRCPAVPRKSGLQHMWHLPGKANIRTMNALFHPPFPELLLLSMMSYGIEYPFIQFGSAVLAMLLPSLLSIPSLPTGGRGRVGKKKPWSCASAAQQLAKLWCVVNAFSAQIQSTAPYGLLWSKLTPSQPEFVGYTSGKCCSELIWHQCLCSSAEQVIDVEKNPLENSVRILSCLHEDPRTVPKQK